MTLEIQQQGFTSQVVSVWSHSQRRPTYKSLSRLQPCMNSRGGDETILLVYSNLHWTKKYFHFHPLGFHIPWSLMVKSTILSTKPDHIKGSQFFSREMLCCDLTVFPDKFHCIVSFAAVLDSCECHSQYQMCLHALGRELWTKKIQESWSSV